MRHVRGKEVGQIAVLGVVPNLLRRIQLRRIGWQPFELKPIRMLPLEELCCRTMHARTVPDENDLAADVAVHLKQEPDHVVRTGVVRQQLKVKTRQTSRGRESHHRDGRQAIVPIPGPLDGGLATGSPGPPSHRLQHEAAFIQESDASLLRGPPFLCAAIPCAANVRWPLHRARERVVLAVDRSSSSCGESSTHDPDGS